MAIDSQDRPIEAKSPETYLEQIIKGSRKFSNYVVDSISVTSTNIESWITRNYIGDVNLLDLEKYEVFNFINSVGVLHHLAEPDKGLRKLSSHVQFSHFISDFTS